MAVDPKWTAFLQWALPQLRMYWPGFRKVRTQVYKRIYKRMQSLHMSSLEDYRRYLTMHTEEWRLLDTFCRITISRFYRDKGVYGLLADRIIPDLVEKVLRSSNRQIRIWSVGCASGEEPYSLSLLWAMLLQQRFPDVILQIMAMDIDLQLLSRARAACYPFSSLKDLPSAWRELAFSETNGYYCLKSRYKQLVLFVEHDVRDPVPATGLQLILCRNLVYSYYEKDLQYEISQRLVDALQPGGVLVLGRHEVLPADVTELVPLPYNRGIYTKPEHAST